jgi:hypothetical protein
MGGLVNDHLRLVQVFLTDNQSSGPAVYEVSLTEFNDPVCTCPSFKSKSKCKHSSFVQTRMDNNNGNYYPEISSRATAEDKARALTSNVYYRDLIIRFGKTEVV